MKTSLGEKIFIISAIVFLAAVFVGIGIAHAATSQTNQVSNQISAIQAGLDTVAVTPASASVVSVVETKTYTTTDYTKQLNDEIKTLTAKDASYTVLIAKDQAIVTANEATIAQDQTNLATFTTN